MNKFFKTTSALALGLLMSCGFTACSDDDPADNGGALTSKEKNLKKASTPYVQNTVIPTYADMADAAILLHDKCLEIQSKFAAGTLTETDVQEAGDYWKQSRKSWELSEAFLFGPAANHNIDPHIDSWPLDKNAMDDLLADIRTGKNWSIEHNGGYGLLGFHAVEYVLFELYDNDTKSRPRTPASYTTEELKYLVAVTEDLRNQCVLLEACWAGEDNISEEKAEILEEAELGYGDNYGWMMENAGQAGSIYKTYQAVAEEIIQGCIDIADEVGNTKIGRPHKGSTAEDRNYIESPYSLNSIEDFQDNIRSIQNAYCGSKSGDASVSDYIKSINPTLDAELRAAIENAITVIGRIPEPFAKSAGGSEAEAAIDACNDLVDVLEKVNAELSKQ